MLTTSLLLGSILFIGDSHSVGPFGVRLDELLRTTGAPVTTSAFCGSIVNDWYRADGSTHCGFLERTPAGETRRGTTGPVTKFSTLLGTARPSHVLVALATNYSGFSDDAWIVRDMRRMAKEVVDHGAHCFWIGMPTSRTLKAQHARIKRLTNQAVGDLCTVFDSFPVTTYPETGGDGIHFYFPGGPEVARGWAQAAFQGFQTAFP